MQRCALRSVPTDPGQVPHKSPKVSPCSHARLEVHAGACKPAQPWTSLPLRDGQHFTYAQFLLVKAQTDAVQSAACMVLVRALKRPTLCATSPHGKRWPAGC